MKDIKIVMGKPFPNYVDISIFDFQNGKERRRAGITADFSEIDIAPYKKEGMSEDEVTAKYEEWLMNTVRRYLLDDCNIVEGKEEFLDTIRKSIKRYF